MFALDVTQSDTGLTESNAATVFKWQFTDATGQGDASGDLGYILAEAGMNNRLSDQPGMVAKMNNGKFAALFPNGYYSTNGAAALYILFATGPGTGGWVEGTHYRKLVADTGSNNGLSQPTWVDTTGDGVADFIYAGDLKGNLWKFDVRCNDPTKWRVAYSGATDDIEKCTAPSGTPKPLFTAKDSNGVALPISGAPEYRFHPLGGQLITFATGRAIVETDFPDSTGRIHSIFAVWDNPAFAEQDSTQLTANLPRLRSSLETRTFTRIGASGAYQGKGYVTGNPFTWTSNNNTHKKGWVVSFPATSEVSISNPLTLQGLAGFVSIVPSTAGSNCGGAPTVYLTLLDPLTGLLKANMLGTYTDPVTNQTVFISSIPIDDQRVIAIRDTTKSECAAGTKGCTRIVGDKTDTTVETVNTRSRLSWKELPGFKTRAAP
jgi:type IV pilus assembly protein PilY1